MERDNNIVVSLTDFIEFAIKMGPPKLTAVMRVRGRGKYSPAADFWKPVRERISEMRAFDNADLKELVEFARTRSDAKKNGRYVGAATGYKKFIGRKQVVSFQPPRAIWTPSRLRVRINPELGLVLNGERHVIKLYFKDEKLTKSRVELLTFLLRNQLGAAEPDARFSVLDVSNSKLHTNQPKSVDLMPLLLGEAASFVAIWDGLT